AGVTTMSKSTVPTPLKEPVSTGVLAFASIRKTSRSGRSNGTCAVQSRPISSSKWSVAALYLTIRPVDGALPSAPGGGGGAPPFGCTASWLMVVDWLPDLNTAAYTVDPSWLRARARGESPKSTTFAIGVPPSAAPSAFASNTWTTARPVPGAVKLAGTGQFWPRRAVVTNARALLGPANRMSRGSSQVWSVRTTRESDGSAASTRTMLMLSDKWFTTHASSALRAATATGSRPTGTSAISVRPASVTSKTARRASGVLTA